MPRTSPITPAAYAAWIAANASARGAATDEPRLPGAGRASVSLLVRVPVGGTGLKDTFASLREQTLPQSEVLLCGEDPAAGAGASIGAPVTMLPSLRDGLAQARAAMVVVVTCGDRLAPRALEGLAAAAAEGADLVYADEDELDGDGRRYRPYFKGAWSPDLFLAQGYVGPFCLLRKDRVRLAVEASAPKTLRTVEDLVLTMMAGGPPLVVRHVPEVLCHRQWRGAADASPVTLFARPPAGLPNARAALLDTGCRRMVWPMPTPEPEVCVVIPTCDRVELLRNTVESLRQATMGVRWHAIVVDNASREDATAAFLDTLAQDARFRVLRDDAEFNFSRLVNRGVAAGGGDYVCLLNNDVEAITPGWLSEMVRTCAGRHVGIVGALLLYGDSTVQHAGCVLFDGVPQHLYKRLPPDDPGHGGRLQLTQDYLAVTAACMVVRREVWDVVGGFDEDLAVAYNDIDFCLRVREAGWRVVWTPHARLFHLESASRGSDKTGPGNDRLVQEKELFRNKLSGRFDPDPYYSPHLSKRALDARLALAGQS